MTAQLTMTWLPVASSLDDQLDDAWTLRGLWARAKQMQAGLGALTEIVRALVPAARLTGAVVEVWTHEPRTPEQVWDAVETVEPHFFEFMIRLFGLVGDEPTESEQFERALGDEFTPAVAERLRYVRTLADQLDSQVDVRALPRNPRIRRGVVQEVLVDPDIAPDVRVILSKIWLLPTMIFVVTASRGARRELALRALHEGLDAMISFYLAVVREPSAPPQGLAEIQPMDLDRIEQEWAALQASWAS